MMRKENVTNRKGTSSTEQNLTEPVEETETTEKVEKTIATQKAEGSSGKTRRKTVPVIALESNP